jgi:hypothetical protein
MESMRLCLIAVVAARQSFVRPSPHMRAIDPVIRCGRPDRRLHLFVCGGLTGRCLRWLSNGLGEKLCRDPAENRMKYPPDLVMSG